MSSAQILALTLVACLVVGGDCIQCYVCDDCDVLDECLLQSCPKLVTTTTETVPPISKTTSTGTGTTGTSTSGTGTTGTSTTLTPNTSPITVTGTTSSSPTLPTTTSASTDEPTTTSDGSSSTTDESSGATDESTSTNTESTTRPSTSVSTVRLKGISTSKRPKEYRSVLMPASTTYHCYSIEVVENNKRKVQRGCIGVANEENACDVLINEFGCSSRKCRVCSESRCNSSDALVFPLKTGITVYMIFLIFQ